MCFVNYIVSMVLWNKVSFPACQVPINAKQLLNKNNCMMVLLLLAKETDLSPLMWVKLTTRAHRYYLSELNSTGFNTKRKPSGLPGAQLSKTHKTSSFIPLISWILLDIIPKHGFIVVYSWFSKQPSHLTEMAMGIRIANASTFKTP